MKTVILTGQDLALEEFTLVRREDVPVVLSEQAKQNVIASHKVVGQIIDEGRVVYGVTTGFGKFSNAVISSDECKLLQENLTTTRVVGAGNPLPRDTTRGVLLLRVNNMTKGSSGCHMEIVDVLIEILDKDVTPQIPEKDSLGASGGLAPLAHMVLPMIGLGQAEYKGETLNGAKATKHASILVMELSTKKGLALINGTPTITSTGALIVYDALKLLKIADVAAALDFEAHDDIVNVLDGRVHVIRPHKGQIGIARILRQLLNGNKNTTHQGEIHVQDAYSLRCVPQIHGASKGAVNFVKQKVEIEINSATGNPIILGDTMEGISGGNFHGQPMALPFDFLGIVIAELANVSKRRMECLVDPALSGLSAFLTRDGGVNSDFMVVQYSAAVLVSKNKILTHPASVDSIPSSTNRENHVSMGTTAAREAREILGNARRVLAMELMCVCQAINIHGGKGMDAGTKPACDTIRTLVSKLEEDRPLYKDINPYGSTLINDSLISRIEEGASKIEL